MRKSETVLNPEEDNEEPGRSSISSRRKLIKKKRKKQWKQRILQLMKRNFSQRLESD